MVGSSSGAGPGGHPSHLTPPPRCCPAPTSLSAVVGGIHSEMGAACGRVDARHDDRRMGRGSLQAITAWEESGNSLGSSGCGLNYGNNLNPDIGRSVTCGLGRNIFLFGAKEAAQNIRVCDNLDGVMRLFE